MHIAGNRSDWQTTALMTRFFFVRNVLHDGTNFFGVDGFCGHCRALPVVDGKIALADFKRDFQARKTLDLEYETVRSSVPVSERFLCTHCK